MAIALSVIGIPTQGCAVLYTTRYIFGSQLINVDTGLRRVAHHRIRRPQFATPFLIGIADFWAPVQPQLAEDRQSRWSFRPVGLIRRLPTDALQPSSCEITERTPHGIFLQVA